MANAAGGTIIYGIAEFRDEPKRHLPEKLSPIARTEFSKERLEQLINSNIKPRIEGIVIHPVSLDSGSDHVAYAVEIPQSTTAHQATDFRYYRRYNFEVLPMLDHEIRDVMGRSQHPKITLEFEFRREVWTQQFTNKKTDVVFLKIFATNRGSKYAKYVSCFVSIPKIILWETGVDSLPEMTTKDFTFKIATLVNSANESQYVPILPGLTRELGSFRVFDYHEAMQSKECQISWTAHADNAPVERGVIQVRGIPIDNPSENLSEE